MLFVGGSIPPYDKKNVYQQIHNRLSTQADFTNVRYLPSRNRPREIHADVDPTVFVDPSYPTACARLEIEFVFRQSWTHYWIQWVEPGRGFSCGWHQDTTHPELGKCHFQIDHPDGSTDRDPAGFLDAHPLRVMESRLADLPEKLLALV